MVFGRHVGPSMRFHKVLRLLRLALGLVRRGIGV